MRSADRSREIGLALESLDCFLAGLIPTVERFPRRPKFLLGDRIPASVLDVPERLVEATYRVHRGTGLAAASLEHQILRLER